MSRSVRMNSSIQIFRFNCKSLIPVISSKHAPAIWIISRRLGSRLSFSNGRLKCSKISRIYFLMIEFNPSSFALSSSGLPVALIARIFILLSEKSKFSISIRISIITLFSSGLSSTWWFGWKVRLLVMYFRMTALLYFELTVLKSRSASAGTRL